MSKYMKFNKYDFVNHYEAYHKLALYRFETWLGSAPGVLQSKRLQNMKYYG